MNTVISEGVFLALAHVTGVFWTCLLTGSLWAQPDEQEAEPGAEAGGQQQGGGGGGVRHGSGLPSGLVLLVSSSASVHHQNPRGAVLTMPEAVQLFVITKVFILLC